MKWLGGLNGLGRAIAAVLGSGCVVVGNIPAAHADFISTYYTNPVTVDGSAANASVTFSLTGTTMTVTMSNYQATLSNGGLLDGLLFDVVSGTVTQALLPTATASRLYSNSTTSTTQTDVTGAWQFKPNVVGSRYGLSAVGGGGLYSAGSFTKGGGGDDYGILGAATNMSTTNANAYPLAFASTSFTLTGFTGTAVANVSFFYNSALTVEVKAPEPASLATLAAGLASLVWARRRRVRPSWRTC